MPDIHAPLPDLAHESLRQSVVAALNSIEAQVQRLDRTYLLLKGTGLGLQGVLNQLVDAQNTLSEQATQIANLETRVAALENPTGGTT